MNEANGKGRLNAVLEWRPGSNLSAFIICLLIALTFWFLNAFTKSYNTSLWFPVRYINMPTDQLLVSELPSSIEVEVSGFGFNILSYLLMNDQDSIDIDYQTAIIKRKGNKSVRLVSGQSIKSLAEMEIPGDIDIVKVLGDTIRFVLEKSEKRMVPVAPKIEVKLANQFFLKGIITVDPTEIEVTGPPTFLNQIDTIYTQMEVFENLDNRFTKDIALELPQGIFSEVKKVSVSIPVDQKTQGTISAPIRIAGNLGDSTLIIFPQEVKIEFLTGLADYEKINSDQFLFEVNVSDIDLKKSYLIVKKKQIPASVTIIGYEPHKVEYIIKR